MLELVLVIAAVVSVGVIGLTTAVITPQLMTMVGLWILLSGLLLGIPTGVWYHVVLYRALVHTMSPPRRWWTSPVQYHARLSAQDVARIKPWFTLGGVGFVLSVAGGLAAMAGLLLSR
jgi:hypothetical protein